MDKNQPKQSQPKDLQPEREPVQQDANQAGRPEPGESTFDAHHRNHLASIAMREIIAWQLANGRGGEESLAASWAYRYADRMLEESALPPRKAVKMVRGRQQPVFMEEPPAETALPTEPVGPIAEDAMQALEQQPAT